MQPGYCLPKGQPICFDRSSNAVYSASAGYFLLCQASCLNERIIYIFFFIIYCDNVPMMPVKFSNIQNGYLLKYIREVYCFAALPNGWLFLISGQSILAKRILKGFPSKRTSIKHYDPIFWTTTNFIYYNYG